MTVRVQAQLISPSDAPRSGAWRDRPKGDFQLGLTGRASFQGPFGEWMGRNLAMTAEAVTIGVKAATEGLKTDLRKAVIQGGLGEKLPNAIRAEIFPRRGVSLGAAGWIYTKGKRTRSILEAYANGATIRAKGGRFLAIPTEHAPGLTKQGARYVSARYGGGLDTRLVVPKDKSKPWLIVANLRKGRGKRGGYRKPTAAAKARRDIEEVVLFILVPQAKVNRRITLEGLGAFWANRVPDYIERALTKNL